MYCIDWEDPEGTGDLLIYGNEKNNEYQRIEVVLVPCNYQHTKWGYTGDKISPKCNPDRDAQIKYLGPTEFLIYHTQETFDQREYGDASIKIESTLLHR